MPQEHVSNILRWSQSGVEKQITIPLEGIVRQSSANPKRVIFALHGFGDNAANFAELTKELPLSDTLWIMLQAPENLPFASDGGQWYDLFGHPHVQLRSSCDKIQKTIHLLHAAGGFEWANIFLLGFSQGAFVSLYTGITFPHELGGIVALSGYLGQAHRLRLPSERRSRLPVFLAHGLNDQVVFPAQHFETLDILDHLGFTQVTAKTYRGVAHSLCAEELFDIRSFIEEIS